MIDIGLIPPQDDVICPVSPSKESIIGLIESTDEHQKDILLMRIGDNKFYPIGVGVYDWLNSNTIPEELKHDITREFIKDGLSIKEIKTKGDELLIDASYES